MTTILNELLSFYFCKAHIIRYVINTMASVMCHRNSINLCSWCCVSANDKPHKECHSDDKDQYGEGYSYSHIFPVVLFESFKSISCYQALYRKSISNRDSILGRYSVFSFWYVLMLYMCLKKQGIAYVIGIIAF